MVDFDLTQTYFLELKDFFWKHRWLFFHGSSGGVGFLILMVGVMVLISGPDLEVSPPVIAQGITPASIQVYVSGAVHQPGVYALTEGQRLSDVITLAGGLSADVDPQVLHNQLNLATRVEDGQHIHIPLLIEATSMQVEQASNNESSLSSQPRSETGINGISVNTATVETLMTLPQIGEKRADDIVAGRPYADVSELLSKKIVTEKMYATIKDLISL